jgi:hypothetical protein
MVFSVGLVLAGVFATLVAGAAGRGGTEPTPADPHRHVIPVHERPWSVELAPQARLRHVNGDVTGHDTVSSPDGRWRAFVVESQQEDRIRVEETRGRRRYELQGLPLPYRPLSDLAWIDGHRLAFDRWSQPHYGLHYVLDVRSRRLILAAPFPDQFFLDQRAQPDSGGRVR